jgi:hypothetical protein
MKARASEATSGGRIELPPPHDAKPLRGRGDIYGVYRLALLVYAMEYFALVYYLRTIIIAKTLDR